MYTVPREIRTRSPGRPMVRLNKANRSVPTVARTPGGAGALQATNRPAGHPRPSAGWPLPAQPDEPEHPAPEVAQIQLHAGEEEQERQPDDAEHPQHLPGRTGLAQRLGHGVETLRPALGIDEGAGGFAEGGDGQQGIGISAAGMYGMLTTGKPLRN